MAENNTSTAFFPKDWYWAKLIKDRLMELPYAGKDIKTLVTMDDDKIIEVIAAVPLKNNEKDVEEYIKEMTDCNNVILNGTGKYITHSTIADCGITGRKLAVDFYGGNCRIGGGSPWTKDGSKADLTLNLYARELAKIYTIANNTTSYASISCCIGKSKIDVSIYDANHKQVDHHSEFISPERLINRYRLNKPNFKNLCKWGLLQYV